MMTLSVSLLLAKQNNYHQSIICCALGIGEAVQHKVVTEAEESKQKAIRCTEEVVRREEALRLDKELTKAKEEWKKERQQIYLEAHHNQLRAIAKETAILEKQLRKEFKGQLAKVKDECRQELERILELTWKEANQLKEGAVANGRQEEQQLALQEAERVAQQVQEETRRAREEAEKNKEKSLADLTETMDVACQAALVEKEREMEAVFDRRIREVQDRHHKELEKVQDELREQLIENESLTACLDETTSSRDNWKEKHVSVKREFSDFLDNCPGFRGEFILK